MAPEQQKNINPKDMPKRQFLEMGKKLKKGNPSLAKLLQRLARENDNFMAPEQQKNINTKDMPKRHFLQMKKKLNKENPTLANLLQRPTEENDNSMAPRDYIRSSRWQIGERKETDQFNKMNVLH